MPSNNKVIIGKLQQAINQKSMYPILYETTQFYSTKANRPIWMFKLKQSYYDADSKKMKSMEAFSTTSQVQIVLWLRDYWYYLNGWDIPKDNHYWNDCKKKYYQKKEGDVYAPQIY